MAKRNKYDTLQGVRILLTTLRKISLDAKVPGAIRLAAADRMAHVQQIYIVPLETMPTAIPKLFKPQPAQPSTETETKEVSDDVKRMLQKLSTDPGGVNA